MPQCVIDDLEVVEVGVDHHQFLVVAQPTNFQIELFDEELPIGQIGQAVVQADMDNLPLALFDRCGHGVEA